MMQMPRKPADKSKSLQAARKRGDVEQFIAGHEHDDIGDLDKLEAAISRRSDQETASKAQKASPKKSSGD